MVISQILNFLHSSVYTGFAVYSILFILVMVISKPLGLYIKENLDPIATYLFLVTAVVYSCLLVYELFIAWYSGFIYEQYAFYNRSLGAYWPILFIQMAIIIILPHLLWFNTLRRSLLFRMFLIFALFAFKIFEIGLILSTSLHRDYLPYSKEYAYFIPTMIELMLFLIIFLVIVGMIYWVRKRLATKAGSAARHDIPTAKP